MSWNEIDNKHAAKYEKAFVACDEYYEKRFLVDTIVEHFPEYHRISVQAVVEHCCRKMAPPRARKEFLQFVAKELSSEYK